MGPWPGPSGRHLTLYEWTLLEDGASFVSTRLIEHLEHEVPLERHLIAGDEDWLIAWTGPLTDEGLYLQAHADTPRIPFATAYEFARVRGLAAGADDTFLVAASAPQNGSGLLLGQVVQLDHGP